MNVAEQADEIMREFSRKKNIRATTQFIYLYDYYLFLLRQYFIRFKFKMIDEIVFLK